MIKKFLSVFLIICLSVSARADQSVDDSLSNKEVSAQADGDYPALHRETSVPLASMQKAWEHAEYGAGVRIVAGTAGGRALGAAGCRHVDHPPEQDHRAVRAGKAGLHG